MSVSRLTSLGAAAGVGLALTVAVAMNVHYGPAARNQRIYDEVSQAWTDWEGLRSRGGSEEDVRAFRAAKLPELERRLATLIADGQRSPDSFSWPASVERQVTMLELYTISGFFGSASISAKSLPRPQGRGSLLTRRQLSPASSDR